MENRIKIGPILAGDTRLANTFFITVLKEMFSHKTIELLINIKILI